jgi:hypothetical protein
MAAIQYIYPGTKDGKNLNSTVEGIESNPRAPSPEGKFLRTKTRTNFGHHKAVLFWGIPQKPETAE